MPAGVANPACVHVIQSGESLSLIADAVDQAGRVGGVAADGER